MSPACAATGGEGTLPGRCLERGQGAAGNGAQPVRRLADVRAGRGERGGVGVERVGVQQRGGADFDDLPGVHHHGAVADGGGQLQVVGDEQHRQPEVAPQAVEDRHDLGLGGDVQGGRRLIGQQQPRLGQQGRGDHDPLQHAAGHLVRVLPEPLVPMVDADLGEHVHRPPARLRRGHPEVGPERLGHEVPDPPHRVGVRPRILEDHRYLVAVPAQVRAGEPVDVGARVPDRALDLGPTRQQAVDRPGGHGLARPRLADQADGLARPHRERDITQHGALVAVHLQQHGQARHLEQRRARCGPGGASVLAAGRTRPGSLICAPVTARTAARPAR